MNFNHRRCPAHPTQLTSHYSFKSSQKKEKEQSSLFSSWWSLLIFELHCFISSDKSVILWLHQHLRVMLFLSFVSPVLLPQYLNALSESENPSISIMRWETAVYSSTQEKWAFIFFFIAIIYIVNMILYKLLLVISLHLISWRILLSKLGKGKQNYQLFDTSLYLEFEGLYRFIFKLLYFLMASPLRRGFLW